MGLTCYLYLLSHVVENNSGYTTSTVNSDCCQQRPHLLPVQAQHSNLCVVPLSSSSTDHKSGNTSLDILLALLQAEGAKIEEETEVSILQLSPRMTSCFLAQ